MPKSINEIYFDEYIKRQLIFNDFSTHQVRQIKKIIVKMELEVLQQMVARYRPGQNRSIAELRRFKKSLSFVDGIYAKGFSNVRKELSKDIAELGKLEYDFHRQFFRDYLGINVALNLPTINQIKAIANTSSVLGKPFFYNRISDQGSWLTDLNAKSIDRFKTRITQSFVEGDALGVAVQKIRGTKAFNYKDGIFKITQDNAEAVTRTGFRSIQQETQNILLNSLGASHVRYTSVLDGRTTAICGQRDGTIYKYAERPGIPAHMRCRSAYVSVFNHEILGERNTITDKRTPKARRIDFRKDARSKIGSKKWLSLNAKQRNNLIKKERFLWGKNNIGRVPIKTTYGQWFNAQSPQFQRSVLGQKKFDLFKTKGLEYKQLVSNNGRFFNIKQLNVKYNKIKGR